MRSRLRSLSLRARVTASSMLVLAAVLLAVGVLTEIVFAAQIRSDVDAQLQVRAQLATQLEAQGLTAAQVAQRVEAPGIRAVVITSDGMAYDGRGGPRGRPDRHRDDDQVLQQPLADGSRLTLVADSAPMSEAQSLLRRTLLLISVGALAVAGVITLLTTRIALAPLDAMTGLARSITRGDRGRRLAPTRTTTELGRTAAAFDAMLDELEGSEARTRRFVADAAHELRTPLAGVQAVAEAAMAPELGGDERERLHLLLLRESRRAGRLVDDLLVMARIDAGIELRHEPVELLALAQGEAERAQLLAPDRTITVKGEPVTVIGDPARLGQVVANLLDNARRHTPAGTAIDVSVGADGTVLVSDSGPGIPPADRERIFDRLVRLDESRSADDGGAGLGLAIARGIARAHGGDLRSVDPARGTGATFALTLPATPPRVGV